MLNPSYLLTVWSPRLETARGDPEAAVLASCGIRGSKKTQNAPSVGECAKLSRYSLNQYCESCTILLLLHVQCYYRHYSIYLEHVYMKSKDFCPFSCKDTGPAYSIRDVTQ